jgi:hypothetical protein
MEPKSGDCERTRRRATEKRTISAPTTITAAATCWTSLRSRSHAAAATRPAGRTRAAIKMTSSGRQPLRSAGTSTAGEFRSRRLGGGRGAVMPRAPFALILQVSDTYLPSVRLLINGIASQRAAFLPALWDNGGGQAPHRTGIQPGQCFAVGGCVRAAGKVLPVRRACIRLNSETRPNRSRATKQPAIRR